eukprot:TRINITY_DN5999_c0_g1_i4.p1 TRINITY_DN5999_c0_g1~~TRINITY_DN5999_c0_g1_i4.p1  ORF type:complete len:222 (-),score=40.31 TRINITY_DN5999_c0_g1_i4:198-863(-)
MDKRALIVLSAARSADFPGRSGVFASSFIAAYQTLSQAGFQVVVATPNSVAPELRCEDDNAAKWVRERKQLFMAATALESLQATNFAILCVPNCIGALADLAVHQQFSTFVRQFFAAKKPIVTAGYGLAGLFGALDSSTGSWLFRDHVMTGISNLEVSKTPSFGKLPVTVQDFTLDHGAQFTCSVAEQATHIVVDRTLVTAQNTQSTALAVRNAIWLVTGA